MIELSLNNDRDLPSLLTRSLAGRCIALESSNTDDVHLYTALVTRWRKGGEAAVALLRELRKLQALSPAAGDFDERPISQTLRELIYAATEAFDFYHQIFPKQLESGRGRNDAKLIRAYQTAVKRSRDPIALMCNRMKHNSREILMGRIVSKTTGDTTFIYRINVALGGVQLPDREVHRDSGFTSVERTLHEIMHGLLRADFNAGELVRTLADNHNLPIELKGPSNLGIAYLLDALGSRMPIVAQSEPGLFNGIQVLADKAVLTRLCAKKVPEPTLRTMKPTVDEAALQIKMFTT